MTYWKKKKPYMGLRNPRFLRRYPLREVTGIRRFGRDAVRMELIRQPRPRRHARAPRGVRTKLDALVLLEERAAGVQGSLQERIFYQALIDHGFIPEVDFTYQAAEFGGRAVLGGLVADFMFETPKVIVQVQSDWHRMSLEIERRDMDQTSMLESLGYTVLEIWPNTIEDRAALDLWIERNITHLWGTSSTPLSTGGNARSKAYREALGFAMDDLARLEARVAQLEAALTGEVIVESELELALSRLEIPSQVSGVLQDSELIARVERLESALFAGGTGPAVRISSGYIAQHLSSSNFISGSTGWRISRDGTAEFQDLIARGSMQSDNFVAGSQGWKIYDTGDAEFHNVTIRGEIIGATFKQNAASAVGGLLMTAPASVIAADITDAATTVTVKDAQFSNDDFIYVKVGGVYEVMQVTAGGGTTSLTVTRGVAGTPTAWKEGTGIIRWGNRLEQDTVSAYSPFLDIVAHNPDGATEGWTDNTDSDSMSLTTGDTYIAWLGDEALGGSGHAPVYDKQTITKVRVWQTQSVSGNIRAGLYRYAVTAANSTAVLLAQGTASFSGAGTVEITLGSSQQIDTLNYYYFFAFQCDNANADLTAFAAGTYHYVRAGVGYSAGLPSPIGSIGSGSKRIAIGVYWTLPYDGSRMKVRLGNLAGVTNPWMSPTGYGLYSQNTYLEGTLVAGSGAVLLDDEGIKITQGQTGANSIRWVDGATTLVSMYGYLVMPGSTARGFSLLVHNSQVTNDAHTVVVGVGSVAGKYGSPAITLHGEYDYTAYINFDASQGGLAHADGQSMRLNLGNLTVYPPLWLSEKSSDPGTPSSGKLAFYAKNTSRPYVQDSAGEVVEVGTLADGVTRTVGSGKDHATVQAAVDWFKGRTVKGPSYIDVDAGTYDEAVVIEGIEPMGLGQFILRGDTRVLAGLSYVDGADANLQGLTNGGSGACSLINGGSIITVTCATTNPDFDADGWGSGDKLLILNNAGTVAEYTVQAAVNNAITLTVTAPAVGQDGTAICLLPNRRIVRSSAGECVLVNGVSNFRLQGFFLKTSTGASCDGLSVKGGAWASAEQVCVQAEDKGFLVGGNGSQLDIVSHALSAWGCAQGFMGSGAPFLSCPYSWAVNCTEGFKTYNFAGANFSDCVAARCGTGFAAQMHTLIYVNRGWVRNNALGTGFEATYNSLMYAPNTNTRHSAATAYTPTPGAIPGTAEDANNFGVLRAT